MIAKVNEDSVIMPRDCIDTQELHGSELSTTRMRKTPLDCGHRNTPREAIH